MSGTLVLVHSGHKTCAGQITEQGLLIDTVGRKGENGRVDWLSQIWLIVLALGQIQYCSNSVTFT